MDWLEQNLDAYRIIAEILNDLRGMIRPALERIHGPEWHSHGIPEPVFARLVESKEQERAIDWYESEYQQIIYYAVFPDLLEILEANADSFAPLLQLAPNSALLQARFLELEVMRSKIGRSRPVSESELAFLGTFHLRFRRAMEALRATGEPGTAPRVSPPPATPSTKPSTPQISESKLQTGQTSGRDREVERPPDEVEVVVADTPPVEPASSPVPQTREVQVRRPPTGPRPPSRVATGAGSSPSPRAVADAADAADAAAAKPASLANHLGNGDDRAVLRELYREVTSLADSIWSADVIPAPLVWEEVCVSPWYEQRFSRLGLKPLSDFYEIISRVEQRMSSGVAKDELHALLKDVNFAQVLLALRDMFQRNGL